MTEQGKLEVEIARLGKDGGEPSALGQLLSVVVETPADLLVLLERHASSENIYVRQRLAFHAVELFKRGEWSLALAAFATLWRLRRIRDAPETMDMMMQLAAWGVRATHSASPVDLSMAVELATAALEELPIYAIPTALSLCDVVWETAPQSLLGVRERLLPALTRASSILEALPHETEVARERLLRCRLLLDAVKSG